MKPQEDQEDKHWKTALKDASESPPDSVWESIERRLDEKKDKTPLIILWWNSKKVLSAAAIALLILTGGWLGKEFLFSTNNNGAPVSKNSVNKATHPPIAQQRSSEREISKQKTVEKDAQTSGSSDGQQAVTRLPENQEPEASKDFVGEKFPKGNSSERSAKEAIIDNPFSLGDKSAVKSQSDDSPENQWPTTRAKELGLKETIRPVAPNKNQTLATQRSANVVELERGPLKSLEMLASLAPRNLETKLRSVPVFYTDNDALLEEEATQNPKKNFYLGFGVMPASFNPRISVSSSPALAMLSTARMQSFDNLNQIPANPQFRSMNRQGFSYAFRGTAGMNLSKKWSLESGIVYLQGNSSYESVGAVMDVLTQKSFNALESALTTEVLSANAGAELYNNSSARYSDMYQTSRNNYSFIQIPMEAGFTLNPDAKLRYTLLGGAIANVFLSNTLDTSSPELLAPTITDGEQGIYKPLNMAASAGLRLSYSVSARWAASLTASYQQALQSSFRSNQYISAFPQLYGISWGMRYAF